MSATQTVATHNRAGSKLQAKRARVDAAILWALTIHTHSEERWEQLQLRGATDAQIYHALKEEFGTGGDSQTEDNIQFAYAGDGEPRFWLDSSTSYTTAKPTLQGNALVKRVREVLKIPQLLSVAAEASPETARAADSDDDESGTDRIVYVDSARFGEGKSGDIASAYSADFIIKGKVRKPFKHDGKLYTCTGGVWGSLHEAGDKATAWRLVPIAEYEGQTFSYNDHRESGYEGIRVKWGKDEFVLSGPPLTFKSAVEDASTSDTPDDAGSHADSREAGSDAHQFKESTGSDGKCVTCKKPRSDEAHKAWAKAQRERVKSGGPALDAGTWRERAAAMTRDIAHKMRPYDTPGRKTLRKIEVYESRIHVALERGQWQATLINLADAVDEGALPAVLFGLTNENQVSTLMRGDVRHVEQYGPQNMGPTIKTADEFKSAVEALKPFIHQLLEDPNLDPRDGTQWAADPLAAGGDAADGSTIAASGDVVEEQACGEDCQHTDEEHWAFDGGLKAGEIGASAETWLEGDEREAWLTGHSVGVLNREATAAKPATDASPVDAPPRIFKSTIEVPLTDGDVAAKARLLSHLRVQIEELLAEKKQTDDGYKNRIGGLEEQCSELFRSIRSGRAELELDVYERRDYERRVVETVRVDCGDVVDSRAMRPTEFQRPLIEL
jgi:hypothetical protein